MVSRIALNDEVAGSNPALAIKPCGVIGNIAPFEGEDSRFESWWGCQTLLGSKWVFYVVDYPSTSLILPKAVLQGRGFQPNFSISLTSAGAIPAPVTKI